MKHTLIYILLLAPILVLGQEERKHIRDGYKAYMNGEYNEAEVDFRKAEEEAPDSYAARYNTATSLYQQDNLEESGKVFSELLNEASNDEDQAKLMHNMGNILLDNKKYQEAVDAYKKSMKLNPKDEDTRYNLAYALQKLDEQQQQEQDQENQDQENKDGEDDQDSEDKKDGENQENQEQENKDQEQQQNQDQQSEEEKQQEQQQQKMELSKDEAERLLNAILQKEKDVKEKVDKKKAAGAKVKTEKDW